MVCFISSSLKYYSKIYGMKWFGYLLDSLSAEFILSLFYS